MNISKKILPIIGVIGIGRIGLCYALLLDQAGYQVYAYDINTVYTQTLKQGVINNNEPNVCNLLKNNHITFTNNTQEIFQNCEIIYIMVPTPSNADGSYDISKVQNIITQICECNLYIKEKIIVVGSTVNPGDCKILEKQLQEHHVSLLYNPVFTAQGSIIKDLQQAEMVLIGGESNNAVKKYQQIYFDIQNIKPNIHVLSLTAAEIAKIAINCYLTTKISFANILGEILIMSQLENEVDLTLDMIGTDARIGKKFFKYGLGYGGPCLPRDNRALSHYASKVGIKFTLGDIVDQFNKQHTLFLADFFAKKNVENLPFYFKHISYKSNIMDIEQSQLYLLCCKLLEKGFMVYIDAVPALPNEIQTSLQQKFQDLIQFVTLTDLHSSNKRIFKIVI
jgi:UDPglucose 6-dehydrogenase